MSPDTATALLDTTASFFLTHKETVDWLAQLAGIVGGGGLIGLLTLLLTKLLPWWRTRRDQRALQNHLGGSLYTKAVIERSTQHYVDPACQVLDPAGAEEPRRLAFNPKDNVFKVIDEALTQSTEYRYLILLADSGMGKTSFLLNYFARHLRGRTRDFLLQLVPLGIPDADERIRKIPDKGKTVLFLDALDEDTLAIVDHAARLGDLVALTRDFQKVLITCRTQFFPKEQEIPTETGVVKVGPRAAGEGGQYLFHKLYLSPFTDEQVEAYLKKRYPFGHLRQRKRARAMVARIRNLSVRPMLLAHIDDLVKSGREVSYSFELYEEMVKAWLKREEGIFPSLKEEPLRQFSERLAVDLHSNRERRGAERIPRGELAGLARQWNIPLDEWQLSSRSLLNRDAKGNYKFAHRSIMEYLVVKRLVEGDPGCENLALTDQMVAFLEEIIPLHVAARKPASLPLQKIIWQMIHQHVAAKQTLPFDPLTVDLSEFRLKLRAEPVASLSEGEVKKMLRQRDFFATDWYPQGKGVAHLFEAREREGVVVDHATGLMWQQSGSPNEIAFAAAEKYVRDMNQRRLAGFNDWRLPTLEEAMSLLEREKKNSDLYIDPLFDRRQRWIWTADKFSASSCWAVGFYGGSCDDPPVDGRSYVRLVR